MSHLPVVPESLYELKFVEDPRISPDGRTVAFVVAQADPDKNRYRRRIWTASTDGSVAPRPFSNGEAEDYAPRWSPDGERIAFISTRTGSGQLYTVPVHGGEPRELTDMPDGVRDPAWSPNGESIAFVSRATDKDRALEDQQVLGGIHCPEAVRAWQEEDRKARRDPRVIEQLPYRTRQEYFDGRYLHVYVISADGGLAHRVTDGDYHHSAPDWMPDSASIVTNSKRAQASGEELYELWSTIFRYDTETGAEEVVTTEVSEESRPVRVSPDGRWVAHILVHKDVESPYQHPYELAVSPMDGGTPRIISADAKLTVADFRWHADSEHLIISIHDTGQSKLARIHRDGGEPEILLDGARWVEGFGVSGDGHLAACAITAPLSPSELSVIDLETGEESKLTEFNVSWVDAHALSAPHEMWYEGAGEPDIQGWFMYPKDFNPQKSYPVAVEIHGGPQIMWGNTFWHEFQVLASRGYFVFFCNPRGSAGYGPDFQLMRGKGGYTDGSDILAGVDALIERESAADEDGLVITGGSYGGFLTGWIVGHTDRFKAAVAQRGVYDQLNMFGSSDVPECVEWYHNGLPREENLLELWEYSPAAYADKVTTPTMLLHSDLDYRVPVSQAEMFFTALRRHGNRDAVLVRYPREGHELSRSGEPRHRIDRLHRIVEWFDRHVQPEARRSRLLNEVEIDAVTEALPEWSLEGDHLVRAVECGRFKVATNLANRVADVASEAEWYPGISVDGGVLSLRVGAESRGLTDRDYVLARLLSLRVFDG